MARRIDVGKWRALYRKKLPQPVDVLNLIHIAHWPSYRWYALTVAPLLSLSRAGPRWMGRLAREIHGPRQADKLLVVRYPNHRAFLRMVSNPYYLLINRFRERGVARFEASFTQPIDARVSLRRHRRFLVVHFNGAEGALDGVREILGGRGAAFVYATREVAAIDLFAGPARPTDPNPLAFKHAAFFAVGADAEIEAIADAATVKRLGEAVEDFALHLYEAEDPRSYFRVFGGS